MAKSKAGRPPLAAGKRLVRQTIMLRPDTLDALRRKAEARGEGVGAYARDVLTRHARRNV